MSAACAALEWCHFSQAKRAKKELLCSMRRKVNQGARNDLDKPQGGGALGTTNNSRRRERGRMKRTILIVMWVLLAASVAYCSIFGFPTRGIKDEG